MSDRKRTKTAMKKEADRIFSQIVRARGICEAASVWGDPYCGGVGCGGNLQTMHIIPRRYLSVRWDFDNALCGCAAHHVYFTHHPLEFAQFLGAYIGSDKFEELQQRALAATGPPDYDAVLARLKATI